MPTTKFKISEQVVEMLKGGNRMAASAVSMREITEAIGQAINSMFKMEQLTVNFPAGDTIPSGVMLAAYENISVYKYQGLAASNLPAIPIALPMNMGIYTVCKPNDTKNPFIPVESGQLALIGQEKIISTILEQIGYEPYGSRIVYNRDIFTEGITSVFIRLAVMDISLYSDYDILPVPASMEMQVVETVFKMMAAQIPTDRIDDPLVDSAVTVKK